MRRVAALLALLVLAVGLWPPALHAQTDDATSTPEPPPASPLPTATPLPTTATLPVMTATLPATTPIPTVVLQLSDILSTTAHVAVTQRDAWALSAPTSPLFLSLGGIVLLVGLILVLVAQVRS